MFAQFWQCQWVNDIKIRDVPRKLLMNLYDEQMQYSHYQCISIGTSMTYSTRYVYKHTRLISTTRVGMVNTINLIFFMMLSSDSFYEMIYEGTCQATLRVVGCNLSL